MGIAISYYLPELHPLSPDQEHCLSLMAEAMQLAKPVLDNFGIPYEERFLDERYTSKPYRRFCRMLVLSGPALGSAELSYGWSFHDLKWDNYDFCKTEAAADFLTAHVAVAEAVWRWEQNGLVLSVNDEGGYLPGRDRERLLDNKAKWAAGIGGIQDLLQNLEVPHRGVAPGGEETSWAPNRGSD